MHFLGTTLPWPIALHAAFLVSLGIKTIFFGSTDPDEEPFMGLLYMAIGMSCTDILCHEDRIKRSGIAESASSTGSGIWSGILNCRRLRNGVCAVRGPLPSTLDTQDLSMLTFASILHSIRPAAFLTIQQNAFLYASAPVRILLALVAGLSLAIGKRTGTAPRDRSRRLFWIACLYDGLGGLALGLWLGTFSGRAPGLLDSRWSRNAHRHL